MTKKHALAYKQELIKTGVMTEKEWERLNLCGKCQSFRKLVRRFKNTPT